MTEQPRASGTIKLQIPDRGSDCPVCGCPNSRIGLVIDLDAAFLSLRDRVNILEDKEVVIELSCPGLMYQGVPIRFEIAKE